MAERPEEERASKSIADMPVVGAETAPDLYIEGYQGALLHNGVVKLNAWVLGFDPEGESHFRRVVARLTMPLATFLQVHDAMGKLINDLEKQGMVQRTEGASNGTESSE